VTCVEKISDLVCRYQIQLLHTFILLQHGPNGADFVLVVCKPQTHTPDSMHALTLQAGRSPFLHTRVNTLQMLKQGVRGDQDNVLRDRLPVTSDFSS
jgi:hypothetical protein